MGKVYTTTSLKETQKLAKEFTKKLKGGDILALHGDLGAGKTTFTQGLAEGLGIKQRIISSTFVIIRQYGIRNPTGTFGHELGITNFYHIDLYRTESEKDIQSLGLEEILSDKNAVVAIEWAEKLGDLLPKKRWDISFEYVNSENREIRMIRK